MNEQIQIIGLFLMAMICVFYGLSNRDNWTEAVPSYLVAIACFAMVTDSLVPQLWGGGFVAMPLILTGFAIWYFRNARRKKGNTPS